MTIPIVDELASIRDHLDQIDELICAAHIQMVIDTLLKRSKAGD